MDFYGHLWYSDKKKKFVVKVIMSKFEIDQVLIYLHVYTFSLTVVNRNDVIDHTVLLHWLFIILTSIVEWFSLVYKVCVLIHLKSH